MIKDTNWLEELSTSRRLDPISCPAVQTEEFTLLGKAVAVQDSEDPLIGFKRRRAAAASGSGGDGGAVVVAGDFEYCGGAEYLMDVLGEMWRSMVHTYKTFWEHLIGPAAMRKVALRERVTSRERGVVYRHDISGNGERHPLLPHNMAECFFADVLASGVLRSADEEDEVANDEEYPKPFWRLSFREWDDAAVVSSTSLTAGRPPCIPFLDTCQHEELDWLLDSVAMKFVWATQVDGQLWRGKVSQTDVSAVLLHADQYVFLLQLLTGVYSPDDFAYRLLERHTFRGEKEGSALCGFQGFLWLICSLLLTPLTRSLRAEDGVDRLKALAANFLSIAPRPRSQVHSFVEQYHLQYGVVAKEDEMMNLVDGVLASVTVSDADGRMSRLKDLETWELVQPYHHTLRDLDLEKVHQTYSGLVHAHNAAVADDATKSGKPPPPREPRVPPVEFGCDIDASADPAWRTCARDLLHTTAVLRVCVLQVLLHAEWVAKRGAAGSNSRKRAADAGHSTEKGFLHALHLLYLSARDAALIARTMANRRRRELGEKLVTQDLDDRAAIDWPLVEDFLARHVWNTCRYDDESVSRLLPVLVWSAGADVGGDAAATMAPCSLAELMRCSVQVSPSVSGAASGPRVLCSVLEDLLLYYRNNASDDHFSYAVMLEHVLCVTSCLGEDRLLRRAAGNEEETRKQKMKERQAELLRKFRSKKGGAAKAGGGDAAEAAAPEVVATSAEASVPDVGFLDVLVYQMCDRQCCICGVAGEDEPLKLLVNTTTSNVLTQVGYTLAAERCSHNHVSTCGHVAHTRCVERFRLLLRLRMFQDDAGIALMCPLCRTPFTSLSPMPEMRRHGSDDGEEGAAAEAMADGVRLVRGWRDGCARDAPLLSVLQSTIRSGGADAVSFAGPDIGACLAMASIGEVAGSTASLPPADALLRERNSAAWELAERMRTVQYQLQLEVEHVKVGGRVAEKTLFGLLSLLLSFDADAVREHEAALREHFARLPSSDFLLLLLDILSLRSSSPRSASALIGDYTARMLRCSPAVDRCVSTLVAECGEAGPITAELVSLWGSLGCLTLLQLLVSEERCSDDVATVRWVFAPKDASVGERVSLASLQIMTLEESLLNHADAGPLSEAVLRMMRYLLPVAPEAVEGSSDWVVAHKAALRTLVADLARGTDEDSLLLVPVLIPRGAVPPSVTDPGTPSMCFSSKAWQRYVAEHILHLPQEYIDLIASLYRDCPNRAMGPKLPVQCRRCLHWVDGVESEHLKIQDDVLYEHVKQCEGSGGAGLFLFLHYNALIAVNAVQKHCGYVRSPYVTQFGECASKAISGVYHLEETNKVTLSRQWIMNQVELF